MELRLIIHDIRSCHNVGSLLRTADAMGVSLCYMTGYTPYPSMNGDPRLPHISRKIDARIHKTALGAEKSVNWQQAEAVEPVIASLRKEGFRIVALEQSAGSTALQDYSFQKKTVLLLGREVEGIDAEILKLADDTVEIPMLGEKESLNVVQAAAMALYACQIAGKSSK
jgi:tRNA G18 (ribose-2'-O)-methylase SpoU